MRNLLCFVFCLFAFCLFAQVPAPNETSEKGLSPDSPDTRDRISDTLSAKRSQAGGQTYAVVVGISDYQDEGIPDLRFADKDAEAFANFLRSPAGGSLDEDHLKVLINKQATAAQFAIALDWLWEVAQENDRVIIYFSGHGDVERKSITQPGYLLCWDAPSRVYMAGGAFNVRDLNDVVSTLSIQNKAKVVLVTDACRAGKLSGSEINGAQATAANLAKQYANEIKILSCQPDEYSIEGEQWGGGRGAFSYHLLDGLYGMADGNADNFVNLKEIGRYLEDYVTEEVAPENQNPMIIGNKTENLTRVFPKVLAQLKEGRKGQLQLFTATESKGIEDEVLAAADTNIVEMYLAFQESIANKNFLCDSTANCTDTYYVILSQEPQLGKLHSSMRRNYAAALQDDAQQVMNKLLKSNPWEANKSGYEKNKNYGFYPELIRRAANLLGKEHYLYNTLMGRSFWFEGYINDESLYGDKDVINAKKIIPFYKKALEFQPEMPHAYMQLSAAYGIQMKQLDSAEYYANLALEYVPNWTLIYDYVANSYLNSIAAHNTPKARIEQDMLKAKVWLERGISADSNSTLLLNNLGYWYSLKGEFAKEQEVYARSLAIDSMPTTLIFSGIGYEWWGKLDKAEEAFQKAYEMQQSPANVSAYCSILHKLGQDKKAKKVLRDILKKDIKSPGYYDVLATKIGIRYPEESIALFQKSLKIDSTLDHVYNYIGAFLSYNPPIDTSKELKMFRTALKLNPKEPHYHSNIGLVYMRYNRFEKAKKQFIDALSVDSTFMPSYVYLFALNIQKGKIEKGMEWLRKGMERDNSNFTDLLLWIIHRYLQDPETTDDYFKIVEKSYPDNPNLNIAWAKYYSFYKKNKEASFVQLEKALKKGYKNINDLKDNLALRDLRLDKERWDALLKKYYPEQYKSSDE